MMLRQTEVDDDWAAGPCGLLDQGLADLFLDEPSSTCSDDFGTIF